MSEWKMVPVEPTMKMIDACLGEAGVTSGYQAMLAAAPAPAFDEAAERAACSVAWDALGLGSNCMVGFWYGWLACAKRKAGVQ